MDVMTRPGRQEYQPETGEEVHKSGFLALAVGAVGVVYGDIGTSPLYTVKEAFGGSHAVAATQANVFGVLSLIFWAVMIVVSLKYVVFVMRADNQGEGGIMALMALVLRTVQRHPRRELILMSLGLFGAALFYGDSVITPAISVLSAVEGLEIATPAFEPFVEPITIAVLIVLFMFQRRGTAAVGKLFGPVMLVWFITLALLGILNILKAPSVLLAINPVHAFDFFEQNRLMGFFALGAVVLALTGAEALYADMGHFGKRPIRLAWFWFVMPALLLNYFGQGALILSDPAAIRNPFYLLAPSWALYPLVGLATLATVIASQAVISGAFSITKQAMQLGYSPRLNVLHTSDKEIGQIYVPWMNWALLVIIIGLVLGFQSSTHLAAAYGVAVTGTMVITTILSFVVAKSVWGWNKWVAGLVAGLFLSIDLAFFSANLVKLLHGGWFPLVMGLMVFTLMSTWKRGKAILFERLKAGQVSLDGFLGAIGAQPPLRVPGTAVFLTQSNLGVPHALLHNLVHNKVLHERVILLTVRTEGIPHVPSREHLEVQPLPQNFFRVILRYGFKDSPDVPRSLERCKGYGIDLEPLDTSYFLSRETLIPSRQPGMALWREKIFAMMARNGTSATAFFRIPTNRVVELGTQIEL
ncbi:potassium transporter Kup [Thermithiobacillus plumbiphilus]|uniref:Probable potassium transport system protein Kup n=1 Tax=Thermithiobacillus plumbiphilus TaxID=1729899 RepID=A0ABU9D7M7_9PROT